MRAALTRRLHLDSPRLAGAGFGLPGLSSGRSLEDVDGTQVSNDLRCTPAISFELAPRCADMDDLVERIGSSGCIRHVRDSEYFGWRFQNPLSRYRFLVSGTDRMDGYLVLQENALSYGLRNTLNIVDWEGINTTIRAELFQAAVTAFAKAWHLVIWAATLPEPEIALLRRLGFRSVAQPADTAHIPPSIIVRPLARERVDSQWTLAGRPLLDLASWDLRMLYLMHG